MKKNYIKEIQKELIAMLTRRSQAFFGMSFRSESRSSCSLSNRSFPIGPVADSFMGLSLNDLYIFKGDQR